MISVVGMIVFYSAEEFPVITRFYLNPKLSTIIRSQRPPERKSLLLERHLYFFKTRCCYPYEPDVHSVRSSAFQKQLDSLLGLHELETYFSQRKMNNGALLRCNFTSLYISVCKNTKKKNYSDKPASSSFSHCCKRQNRTLSDLSQNLDLHWHV